MAEQQQLGGRFSFPETPLTVHRMGYGAMQLAGPHVFGPPRDRDEAVAVLHAAVEAGVDHIEPQPLPAMPETDQHATARPGVFYGVGREVLHDPRHQHPV